MIDRMKKWGDRTGIALVLPHSSFSIGDLSFFAVALTVIVNPLYEENFLCGYLLSIPNPTANKWALIEISIAPLGIIFALWFDRTRNLWPIVIAHGALDGLALAPYLTGW